MTTTRTRAIVADKKGVSSFVLAVRELAAASAKPIAAFFRGKLTVKVIAGNDSP